MRAAAIVAGVVPVSAIPVLVIPVLAIPVLAIPVLVIPVLAIPVLAIPVLAIPVLAIPVWPAGGGSDQARDDGGACALSANGSKMRLAAQVFALAGTDRLGLADRTGDPSHRAVSRRGMVRFMRHDDRTGCRVSTAVVQRFCKPKAGGSNPSPGTTPRFRKGPLKQQLFCRPAMQPARIPTGPVCRSTPPARRCRLPRPADPHSRNICTYRRIVRYVTQWHEPAHADPAAAPPRPPRTTPPAPRARPISGKCHNPPRRSDGNH